MISPDAGWQAPRRPLPRLPGLLGPLGLDAGGLALRSLMRASIITPGDWIELDLDPATRHTSIRRAVRRAIVRSPRLEPHGVQLIRMLDDAAQRAIEGATIYCASRVVEHATGHPSVATVLIQICASDVATRLGMPMLRVSERCAGLANVLTNDLNWAGADVRVVELPFVGPAVRLHIEDRAIIMQYLVPLAGGMADAVLTFSCPCPPYARVMTQLFDTMAESLVLHYE